MRNYILRRLAQTVPVMLGVATVVFLALRLIPGDPAIALAGEKASVAEIARMREDLGLNQPLPVQYVTFLGHMATLQLGRSIRTGGNIDTELVANFAPTIELSLSALLIALVVGLPGGHHGRHSTPLRRSSTRPWCCRWSASRCPSSGSA